MKIEDAWFAGLYEGEGSVSARKGWVRVSIGMTDLDVLTRFHARFGGSLYGPRRSGHGKPMYYWQLRGWPQVEAFYAVIKKWLCGRRAAQFASVLAGYRAPTRVAPVRPPPCGFDRNRPSGSGHVAHWKRGEPACDDCYHAAKLYRLRRKQNAR